MNAIHSLAQQGNKFTARHTTLTITREVVAHVSTIHTQRSFHRMNTEEATTNTRIILRLLAHRITSLTLLTMVSGGMEAKA